MLTYGFYNSMDHDRLYDATQFGSIFDGIVRDGVFMSIGNCLRVKQDQGMTILVDTGRAWFDHTWTLNDALLPLVVPQSEMILNRIDAVVLEVNHTVSIRQNFIKIVKGTPATNPARPTLVKNDLVKQYPLAYIYVAERTTSIRQENITNMIGTGETPFVTGILQTINADMLLAQWADQWKAFYERETNDITTTKEFWKNEWIRWYEAQTKNIQDTFLGWVNDWETWREKYYGDMVSIGNYWKWLWEQWFYAYVNDNTKDIDDWKFRVDTEFRAWWDSIKELIEENAAANLAQELLSLKQRVEVVEAFRDTLIKEHAIYYILYDNDLRHYEDILDSEDRTVKDSDDRPIQSRTYSSEPILDHNGEPIEGRVIFCTMASCKC